MWGERLSEREGQAMQQVLPELLAVAWAKPLAERIDRDGGLNTDNMPLLFEARFAHALLQQGLTPEYEYRGGVGDTVVDFRVPGNPDWLFELTSIRPSEAVNRATIESGPFISRFLQSPSMENDGRENEQSEEGEMLLALQKIGEKVYDGNQAVKFPEPDGRIHVIVVDMRAFLNGGDHWDYRQIAYGPDGVPQELVHCWLHKGQWHPIRGLFEPECPSRAARYIQQRIHFLAFVAEESYELGEILKRILLLPNPGLLSDNDVKAVAARCPVKFGT
ncbi:hypothetical protein [Burkholderia thailandensis]|uniref:hypothetical protein n=1 Tax=Burkholderia thailandensis TaxID=57975 RepID=UPI0022AC4024|nr:hypothetical protein [Burkholderia thailandensis]MCZ2903313.1 hypothetical protein [Burkholderia thailandensis]MDD1484592.1 hypothetical protein [Burkholderia thailandensis]MDD1490306.1 hypothetical protein [Burkholderia thailandensis]MDD1496524.1 hypothetical protein [Burkholderia thailandensis]